MVCPNPGGSQQTEREGEGKYIHVSNKGNGIFAQRGLVTLPDPVRFNHRQMIISAPREQIGAARFTNSAVRRGEPVCRERSKKDGLAMLQLES